MSGGTSKASRSLGEAIRQAREHRRMTLRALARAVGVSAPFLSDVEHDRRNTDRLPEIARALGVDPDLLRCLDTRTGRDQGIWRRLIELEARVADLERATRAVGEQQSSKERG